MSPVLALGVHTSTLQFMTATGSNGALESWDVDLEWTAVAGYVDAPSCNVTYAHSANPNVFSASPPPMLRFVVRMFACSRVRVFGCAARRPCLSALSSAAGPASPMACFWAVLGVCFVLFCFLCCFVCFSHLLFTPR